MQAMIYGIGPNPMADDFNDEDDGDFKVSPYNVYVCDKKTWTDEQHCNDSCVDQPMREKLGKAGFAESMESIYEPTVITMTEEQIRQAMEKLKYVYNEDFAKFMESSFG
jgi:hypothetical protein